MFWPNDVCKPFYITIFYELFLLKQIFNIFNCHCALFDQILSPFRRSCCVKMIKRFSKSTFLECFDLIMSGICLYYIILLNLFSWTHFQHFYCHCALFDQVLAPFRRSCCVKMAQSYSKSTFLACFDLIMSETFLVPRRRRIWDLWFHLRSFVRPSVRPSVCPLVFLGNYAFNLSNFFNRLVYQWNKESDVFCFFWKKS